VVASAAGAAETTTARTTKTRAKRVGREEVLIVLLAKGGGGGKGRRSTSEGKKKHHARPPVVALQGRAESILSPDRAKGKASISNLRIVWAEVNGASERECSDALPRTLHTLAPAFSTFW